MARSFEISLPPARREGLVQRLEGKPGIVGISLQRGASIDPPGDVLTIQATNEGAATVLHALDDLGLGDAGSFTISEPTAMVVPSRQHAIAHETNEGNWEEMASLLRRDTNPSVNFFLLMIVAGIVATVGLWNGTLHIVIGAMLIAPGFEPIMRVPFALIGRSGGWRRGIVTTITGYGCLAAGAAVTLLIIGSEGGPGSQALGERPLVQYWTSVGYSDALVALVAGAAGATIVSSRRTVFSAGVMVALGLIPAMAIVGMALVFGEPGLAGQGLLRWGLDVVCVLVSSAVVLGLKQRFLHRRRSLDRPGHAQAL